MRSLKRPLSILIAAVMLLSIMVIAPATASATTVEAAVHKWLKAENVTGEYYRFKGLYNNLIVVRANPDVEFKYGFDSADGAWNRSGDLTIGNNKYVVNTTNDGYGHSLGGYWGNDPGHNNDGYIYLSDELPSSPHADWYAYTWETFTLTKHDAVYGANGNLQYYTDENNDGRYFVADGGSYKEVNRSDVFFDYVTANGKGFNTTGTFSFDNADPLKDTLAESGLTGAKDLQTIGVQTSTGRVESGFRFLTVVKSDILDAADDFGYIVVKTEQGISDVRGKAGQLNAATIDASAKYSCKGTENDFADNYGSSDLSSTDYKYISCFVKDPDSDNTVVSRFYVKVDGNTYFYAQYTPDNSTWYDGCAYALS